MMAQCKTVGILEGVKDTENVNASIHGLLHCGLDYVVRVRGISQRIHTAEQHLQGTNFFENAGRWQCCQGCKARLRGSLMA